MHEDHSGSMEKTLDISDAGDITIVGYDLDSDVWSRGEGAVSIANCVIAGSIWSLEQGGITIANSSISGSVRSQQEGVITVIDSVIEEDIWSRGQDDLRLTNSTVQGNVWHRGDIYITNSEILGEIQCDRYVYRDGEPAAIINYYTIVPGDTLWGLARMCLGDGSRWTEIQDLNGGIDPLGLPVGTRINIPIR